MKVLESRGFKIDLNEIKGVGETRKIHWGNWQAVIDSYGAQVLALFYQGENVLHYDSEDIGHSGIPLCLPNFGPLDDGLFIYQNQEYQLPQHGFIRHRHLNLASFSQDSLSYEFYSDSESMQSYPFEFNFLVTFTLSQCGLSIDLSVQNLSEEPLPLSPGVHPYFKVDDPDRVEFTSQAVRGNNLLNAYREEELSQSKELSLIEDGETKLYGVEGAIDMHLISHGLEKTKILRQHQAPILLQSDPAVFKRVSIWRPSVLSPFLCVEPSSVKNGLNEQPLMVGVGQCFETKIEISLG